MKITEGGAENGFEATDTIPFLGQSAFWAEKSMLSKAVIFTKEFLHILARLSHHLLCFLNVCEIILLYQHKLNYSSQLQSVAALPYGSPLTFRGD